MQADPSNPFATIAALRQNNLTPGDRDMIKISSRRSPQEMLELEQNAGLPIVDKDGNAIENSGPHVDPNYFKTSSDAELQGLKAYIRGAPVNTDITPLHSLAQYFNPGQKLESWGEADNKPGDQMARYQGVLTAIQGNELKQKAAQQELLKTLGSGSPEIFQASSAAGALKSGHTNKSLDLNVIKTSNQMTQAAQQEKALKAGVDSALASKDLGAVKAAVDAYNSFATAHGVPAKTSEGMVESPSWWQIGNHQAQNTGAVGAEMNAQSAALRAKLVGELNDFHNSIAVDPDYAPHHGQTIQGAINSIEGAGAKKKKASDLLKP